MKEYFKINVHKYDETKDFDVVRPSPLNQPKDNSVIFVMPEHLSKWEAILAVKECLVFWPESHEIPSELSAAHAVVPSDDPRYSYALFFRDNGIVYNPKPVPYEIVNGVYMCEGATVGENCTILPGAYLDSEVVIGNNCYIGSGVRLMGSVKIGNDCIIRENAVIGTDGLTTNKDENGKVVTIPQFGGVTIEDDVQIGANTVICKGAIGDTLIHTGCRIDNCCFISHNVQLGEDTIVVGETIMFGSTSTGKQAFISGNATIRDRKHIGEKAVIGMGSVVVKDVEDGAVVKGNPAK